jgi:hypothetical protein
MLQNNYYTLKQPYWSTFDTHAACDTRLVLLAKKGHALYSIRALLLDLLFHAAAPYA